MRLLICLRIGLAVLGAILIGIGIAVFLAFPAFFSKLISQNTYLGRDSNGTYNEVLQKYIDPPYQMRFQVWTFSVQNPFQIMKEGEKPRVVEKGPYTFIETQHKPFIKFKDNDTRLLYRNNRRYEYSSELSCADCKWSDKVTIPNLVFQKIVDVALDHPLLRFLIDPVLSYFQETAFITITVGELLFDGYKDPIVDILCKKIPSECKKRNITGKIGLFYQHNNTDDGLYEVGTGKPNVLNLGNVYSWNGMTGELNKTFWNGEQARLINGTDAQLYPPQVLLQKENIHMFIGGICRSIEMEFIEAVDVQGLPAYRYSPAKSMSNVDVQREMGFCLPKTPQYFHNSYVQQAGCLPSGLLDLSGCTPDAPRIYASGSHFLGSPKELRLAVEGIEEPDVLSDTVTIDIEPNTGVVVAVKQRTQLNVGVLRGNLAIVRNMKEATIIPVIWLNEGVIFDPETRSQLLSAVSAQGWANLIAFIFIGVGVACFIGFIVLALIDKYRYENELNRNNGHEDHFRDVLVPNENHVGEENNAFNED